MDDVRVVAGDWGDSPSVLGGAPGKAVLQDGQDTAWRAWPGTQEPRAQYGSSGVQGSPVLGPGLLAAAPRPACRVGLSFPLGGGHHRDATQDSQLPLPHPWRPEPGWEGWGFQMRTGGATRTACWRAQPEHIHVRAHTFTQRHVNTRVCTHMHTETHAHTCTCIHTDTCT